MLARLLPYRRERLDALNPGRSARGVAFYQLCYFLSRAVLTAAYRLRVWDSGNLPPTGPVLVIANHQSHFDPVLVGMALPSRHLNFVARATLFAFKPFGTMIAALNAFPLKQGESDTVAIRATIELLRQGRVVLIFPEGSRTPDGEIHEFKRGAWLLMSRAKCPIVPVGIEGAFAAFPRGAAIPRVRGIRMGATVGSPLDPAELLAMGPEAGLIFLKQRVAALKTKTAERLQRAGNNS
ncbi:N/A [soil metagenome]